jgi:anti-sigma regulatory factor (Ser/Thr protein kinase)
MKDVPDIAMTIAREVEAFEGLLPAVERFLEANAIPARQAFLARLALEEMILNLIKHSQGGSNQIDVSIQRHPKELVIGIEDDGAPFDPRALPKKRFDQPLVERAPGGMGIHLVCSMMDDVRYGRRADRNRLEMDIRLPQ